MFTLKLRGYKTVEAPTLEDVSREFQKIRDQYSYDTGGGSRGFPNGKVYLPNKKLVAIVSWNGRVWDKNTYNSDDATKQVLLQERAK